MAIGGMALAIKLRHEWPELVLNETHPKVLLQARWGQRYDPKGQKAVEAAIQWFVNQGHHTEAKIEAEHELDAALSASATRDGLMDLQKVGKTSSEKAAIYSFRLDRYGIYGLGRSPSNASAPDVHSRVATGAMKAGNFWTSTGV